MIVYEALYNPMIHESSARTLSIHLSREGAEKAIVTHKEGKRLLWEQMYEDDEEPPYAFGTFEDWFVAESEIFP